MKFKFGQLSLDIILGFALILASFVMLTTAFMQSRAIEFPLTILLGGFIYLITRRSDAVGRFSPPSLLSSYLVIPQLTMLLASIASLGAGYGVRPSHYFLFISLAITFLIMQVALFREDAKLMVFVILGQIIATSIIIRLSLFLVSGSLSLEDPSMHLQLARNILKKGKMPFPTPYWSYYNFPILHLTITMASIVTGAEPLAIMPFSVAFVESLTAIAVFLVAKYLFGLRAGLLAATLTSFMDYLIFWGFHQSPASIGIFLVIMTMYLLIRISKEKMNATFRGLTIVILGLIVITHPLSNVIALLAFTVFVVAQLHKFLSAKHSARTNIRHILPTLFWLVSLWYWMYATGQGQYSEFSYFVGLFQNVLNFPTPLPATPMTTMASSYMGIEWFGHRVILFLAIIGTLYGLSEHSNRAKRLPYILASMSILLIPYVAFYSGHLSSILPDRWLPYAYALLIPLAAGGIVYLTNSKRKLITGVMIVVLTASAFIMVSNTISAPDNPQFHTTIPPREYLLQSEVTSLNFLLRYDSYNVYTGGHNLILDYYSHLYLKCKYLENPSSLTPLHFSLIVSHELYSVIYYGRQSPFRFGAPWIIRFHKENGFCYPLGSTVVVRKDILGKYLPIGREQPEEGGGFGYVSTRERIPKDLTNMLDESSIVMRIYDDFSTTVYLIRG